MFDQKAFMKSEFSPRMEDVPVPDLIIFFKEGTKPVWKVRNLSGHEMGKVNEAAARNQSIAAIIDGIVSAVDKDKVDAIKLSLGLDDSTPMDIARRLEMLVIGSVDPKIDQETAVKLCTHYPVEFFQITQVITRLTGQGSEIKKKRSGSGATPESKTA